MVPQSAAVCVASQRVVTATKEAAEAQQQAVETHELGALEVVIHSQKPQHFKLYSKYLYDKIT